MTWYLDDATPDAGIHCWAVEHRGHPALYLRALLPGDFAPGLLPAIRHVLTLSGERPGSVTCGTCGEVPAAADLEPIERATGARGFLRPFREGRAPWPRATDPETCWECSTMERPAAHEVRIHARHQYGKRAPVPAFGPEAITVKVCDRCRTHLQGRR